MAAVTAAPVTLVLNDFFSTCPDTVSGALCETPADSTLQRRQYLELEIQQVSSLLEPVNSKWSRVPRLYIVLRLIDQLHLLDAFLAQGLSDFWFPFSLGTLPDGVPLAVRSAFVKTQDVVLTKAVDLEKGEKGRHRHFAEGEPLPFESKGLLGSGGFGAVDRVISTVSGHEYARKRMPRGKGAQFARTKEQMKAFRTELEVLKRLHHRHVVEYVGSYTDRVHLGIIMAPVADGNLSWFLDRIISTKDGRAAADDRVQLRGFFGCLASALAYLHSSQIRHKDIKPQNILVKGANVLFTDFGISLDWTENSRSTTKGPAILTPRYCAPEVAEYEPRGSSSDVWSLGCVFLEMLTVLKGRTLQEMRQFYESHGSESQFFRMNAVATDEWMKALEKIGATQSDNRPMVWIRKMLEHERAVRISAVSLLEQTTAVDLVTGQASKFCGSCCLEEEESSGDDFDEESDLEDDIVASGVGGSTTVTDVFAETQHLQEVAETLTREKVATRRWKSAAETAMARLENDVSLAPSAGAKLQQHLVALLRDAGWGMLSADITGSHPLDQKLAGEMLELLERLAMLRQDADRTRTEQLELAKCADYMSAMLTDQKLVKRLHEVRQILLKGQDTTPSAGQVSPTRQPSSVVKDNDTKSRLRGALDKLALNVLAPSKAKETPLHIASRNGDMAELNRLLSAGANISAQSQRGQTALHLAALGGHEACVIKLLSCGAKTSVDDSNRCTPLHLAAAQGNRIVVRELLTHGTARLNSKTQDSGFTPLHFAVQGGNIAAAELLLRSGANVEATDSEGRAPLLLAPDEEMVSVLLSHRATVIAKDSRGRSALHLAVTEGRANLVPALLAAGLGVADADRSGRNALHTAVAARNHALVKLLLEKDGSAIDIPAGDGSTPLHMATSAGDVELVNLLVQHGAQTRFDGFSPLHVAVAKGHSNLVELSHSHGQDLNVKGKDGRLPLDVAAASRDMPTVKYLVAHGARFTPGPPPDDNGPWTDRGERDALHAAIEKGDEELVELLLDSLGSDAEKGSGKRGQRSDCAAFRAWGKYMMTPLCSAVLHRHIAITRMLLDRGADPNTRSGYYIHNCTPLIQAVKKGDVETVRLLLEYQADVHMRDDQRMSAIHCAAEDGNMEIASLLLDHGASVNDQFMFDSSTPLSTAYHALVGKHPAPLDFLLEKGATVHGKLLELAVHEDRAHMMAALLAHPERVEPPPTPEHLGKLLVHAASRDAFAALGPLLAAGAPPDFDHGQALRTVLRKKNDEAIKTLLEAGADARAPQPRLAGGLPVDEDALYSENLHGAGVLLASEKGRSGRSREQVLQEWLRFAAARARPSVVRWLFDQGADGNVQASYKYAGNGYMQSPLQWAADNNDLEMVRERLARGDNVAGLRVCHTPLQLAARNANADMAQLLLDHGAGAEDVGQPPGDPSYIYTPLLLAVRAGSAKIVRMLLFAGADPNRGSSDPRGRCSQGLPLTGAVDRVGTDANDSTGVKREGRPDFYMDMVHALLDAGADPVRPCYSGGDALSCAVGRASGRGRTPDANDGDDALVRLLLDRVPEGGLRAGGVPALFRAAEDKQAAVARLLLDRGVDAGGRRVNSSSGRVGPSVLWSCALPGHEEVVRLLVERGADPDEKGSDDGRQSARERAERTYDTLLIGAMGPEKPWGVLRS